MATIFFLSPHCGNGPIFVAGSVLVKSGLFNLSERYFGHYNQYVPVISIELPAGNGQRIVHRIRASTAKFCQLGGRRCDNGGNLLCYRYVSCCYVFVTIHVGVELNVPPTAVERDGQPT